MFHSLSFIDPNDSSNNKHTWDSWHIVPTSKPIIAPAAQKRQTLDIPGGNGTLDVSRALTGYPVYNNREGEIEFVVVNDNNYETSLLIPNKLVLMPWTELLSEMQDYFDGKELQCILDDDPDYYYTGYWSVSAFSNDEKGSIVTLKYSVDPYKYLIDSKRDKTKWTNLEVGSNEVSYKFNKKDYGMKAVSPVIRVEAGSGSDGVSCVFINKNLNIKTTTVFPGSSTYSTPFIVMYGGEVEYKFVNKNSSGATSKVTIDFIPGVL